MNERYFQQAEWTKDIRSYLMKDLGDLSGKQVLDVGCGTGALAKEFSRSRWFGLDIDLSALIFGKQTNELKNVLTANGVSMPFADQEFDLIFAHYLLLWVDRPLELINEARRVCKKNAPIIFFAEPDHAGRIDHPIENKIIGEQQTRALEQKGIDIQMGRKLGSLLISAGLRNVRFGLVGGEWRGSDTTDALEKRILLDDLGPGHLDDPAYIRRDGGFIYVPTFYAFGFN